MSSRVMTDPIAEVSPRSLARIAATLYLLTILTGVFAQGFVAARLIVPGDAAATAAGILAQKSLYQLGFTVYLVEMALQIAMTSLFYDLLKPVSRPVSLLAAFLGLAGCAIKTLSRVFYLAPLFVLEGSPYLNVFSAEQRQALALLFLKVNDQGAGIALALFGFAALLKGYLILRSTFLPRILGVLSVVAGVCLLGYLSPPLGNRMFPVIAVIGLVGSLAQIGWLLIKGVDEERWKQQATAAAASLWR